MVGTDAYSRSGVGADLVGARWMTVERLFNVQRHERLLSAPSPAGADADVRIDRIADLRVPTSLVERHPRRWAATPRQIEWVRSDHALGLEIAVHHLHLQGHQRMGLVVAQGSPTSAHL